MRRRLLGGLTKAEVGLILPAYDTSTYMHRIVIRGEYNGETLYTLLATANAINQTSMSGGLWKTLFTYGWYIVFDSVDGIAWNKVAETRANKYEHKFRGEIEIMEV